MFGAAAAAAPNIDALAKEWGMQHAMVQLMLDTAGRPPPRTADGAADDALAARLRRAQTAVSEHIERNVRLRRENRELMQQAVASLQATAGVPGLPRANQAAPAPFVAPPARRAVDMGNEAVRPPAAAAPFAAPPAVAVVRRPSAAERHPGERSGSSSNPSIRPSRRSKSPGIEKNEKGW